MRRRKCEMRLLGEGVIAENARRSRARSGCFIRRSYFLISGLSLVAASRARGNVMTLGQLGATHPPFCHPPPSRSVFWIRGCFRHQFAFACQFQEPFSWGHRIPPGLSINTVVLRESSKAQKVPIELSGSRHFLEPTAHPSVLVRNRLKLPSPRSMSSELIRDGARAG
jgi:hypothetical protein